MLYKMLYLIILIINISIPITSWAFDVSITPELPSMQVLHNGRTVTIMRNQNQSNTINPVFAKTSRKCPPFCIQPMELAPGIKTIGELEILHYLQKVSNGDKSVLVIDSRTPGSVAKGTIPGAVNIPADSLDSNLTDPTKIREILNKEFEGIYRNGSWDFSKAKTLVLFCNGPWCSQSSTSIKMLLKLGYPAHKLIWYRGGMQSWEIFGLTTVASE